MSDEPKTLENLNYNELGAERSKCSFYFCFQHYEWGFNHQIGVIENLKKINPNNSLVTEKFDINSHYLKTFPVVNYEFHFFQISSLPKTEKIIFQVLSSIDAKNSHQNLLCLSCKKFNLPLITFFEDSPNSNVTSLPACSGWSNSLTIKFHRKIFYYFPFIDESFFLLEQFFRRYSLHHHFHFVFLSSQDTLITNKNFWDHFDQQKYDYWFTIPSGIFFFFFFFTHFFTI